MRSTELPPNFTWNVLEYGFGQIGWPILRAGFFAGVANGTADARLRFTGGLSVELEEVVAFFFDARLVVVVTVSLRALV